MADVSQTKSALPKNKREANKGKLTKRPPLTPTPSVVVEDADAEREQCGSEGDDTEGVTDDDDQHMNGHDQQGNFDVDDVASSRLEKRRRNNRKAYSGRASIESNSSNQQQKSVKHQRKLSRQSAQSSQYKGPDFDGNENSSSFVNPAEGSAASPEEQRSFLKPNKMYRNAQKQRYKQRRHEHDAKHDPSVKYEGYVTAMIPKLEKKFKAINLDKLKDQPPAAVRYSSLPVDNRSTDADHTPDSTAAKQLVTKRKLERSPSPVNDRERFYNWFQVLIRKGTERAGVERTARGGEFWMRGRGRRFSRMGMKGSDEKNEMNIGDFLWLNLRTYLMGLPMRSEAEIKISTKCFDSELTDLQNRRRHCLKEIAEFRWHESGQLLQSYQSETGVLSDNDTAPGTPAPVTEHPDSLSVSVNSSGLTAALHESSSSSALETSLNANEDVNVALIESSDHVQLTVAFMEEHQAVKRRVGQLLHKYEALCEIYPSSKTMATMIGNEYTSLQDRIQVLYVWYNISTNIAERLHEIGLWVLGFKKKSLPKDENNAPKQLGVSWPFVNCYIPGDRQQGAESDTDDDENGNLNQSDGRKSSDIDMGMVPSTATFSDLPSTSAGAAGRHTVSSSLSTPSTTVNPAGELGDLYLHFVQKNLRKDGMPKALNLLHRRIVATLVKARMALDKHTPAVVPLIRTEAASVGGGGSQGGTGRPVPHAAGLTPKLSSMTKFMPLTPNHQYKWLRELHNISLGSSFGQPSSSSGSGGSSDASRMYKQASSTSANLSFARDNSVTSPLSVSFNKTHSSTSTNESTERYLSAQTTVDLMDNSMMGAQTLDKSDDPPVIEKEVKSKLLVSKQVPKIRCGEELLYGERHRLFAEMNLPSFKPLFMFLLRISLDLVHQWLRYQIAEQQQLQNNMKSDGQSVHTLMRDCHDCLEAAVEVKVYYQDFIQATTTATDEPNLQTLLVNDLQAFERDLTNMFYVYLVYVREWVTSHTREVDTPLEWWQKLMKDLENEWKFAKAIAISVESGEGMAAKMFCNSGQRMFDEMVSEHLTLTYERILYPPDTNEPDDDQDPEAVLSATDADSDHEHEQAGPQRHSTILRLCRDTKRMMRNTHERATRALGFAKLLKNDLEIATKFALKSGCAIKDLLTKLHEHEYVMVIATFKEDKDGVVTPRTIATKDYLMFCEPSAATDHEHLQLLLNVTCGRNEFEVPKHMADKRGHLILVKSTKEDEQAWRDLQGGQCYVNPDPDTLMSLHYMQIDGVYLVVVNSKFLPQQRLVMHDKISNELIVMVEEQCSCHELIAQEMEILKSRAMSLRDTIMRHIHSMSDDVLNDQNFVTLNSVERQSYRDTMIQAYNFAFEYHRELARFLAAESRAPLARHFCDLVDEFTEFVQSKFAPGHKSFPRWANPVFFFLVATADPKLTSHLSQEEFEKLKDTMTACATHIIGGEFSIEPGDARYNALLSPTRMRSTPLIQLHAAKRTATTSGDSPRSTVPDQGGEANNNAKPVADQDQEDKAGSAAETETNNEVETKKLVPTSGAGTRYETIRQSCMAKDNLMNKERRERRLIGREVEPSAVNPVAYVEGKKAPFRWRKMEKFLGRGRFGAVYQALNLDATDPSERMMAMKQIDLNQIRLSESESEMRTLVDEFRNLSAIRHPNLVRFYGIEVHRDDISIFMELCDMGTLERVCSEGLIINSVRIYTYFLLKGVQCLHQANIVHRDIKPLNIFMSSGPERLKLGDFGCSFRFSDGGTVRGQLTDLSGTHNYMAPEVCRSGQTNKGEKRGYGRAADIWSVGCVVLQMITGKPPWHEYVKNDRAPWPVIFLVGDTGRHPPYPLSGLDKVAEDFLNRCFAPDQDERAVVEELLEHQFCRVVSVEQNQVANR